MPGHRLATYSLLLAPGLGAKFPERVVASKPSSLLGEEQSLERGHVALHGGGESQLIELPFGYLSRPTGRATRKAMRLALQLGGSFHCWNVCALYE